MDSKKRFSDRVANYVKARPGYPKKVVELLQVECGLTRESVVADVGSGTGILARLFCENGNPVYGVEPNEEMRQAGELHLAEFSNFVSVNGSAELTTLPGTSMDFITAGQAFHWFDKKEARHEFLRILKPNGWAVLVWNNRKLEGSAVAEGYEQLAVDYGTDYQEVKHLDSETPLTFEQFFGHSEFKFTQFANPQKFDREGLVSRILSASYMPGVGHPRHVALLDAIYRLFDEHQRNGVLELENDTHVYYGQMS